MALTTHIEGLTIHELLRIVSNSSLSGVLTVTDQDRSGRIVFVWGRVIHASASGQERLGEMLHRRGVISIEDLETALRTQKGQKKARPLGTILCALGFAATNQVQQTLREQMKNAFFEIMEWQDGDVHLHLDGETEASLMLDVCLDTQVLLLEAARRDDENQASPEAGLVLPDPAEASEPRYKIVEEAEPETVENETSDETSVVV